VAILGVCRVKEWEDKQLNIRGTAKQEEELTVAWIRISYTKKEPSDVLRTIEMARSALGDPIPNTFSKPREVGNGLFDQKWIFA
jgi:hypothetical protein